MSLPPVEQSGGAFGAPLPPLAPAAPAGGAVPLPAAEVLPTPGLVHVFLDVKIGRSAEKRVIIALHQAKAPRTVESFRVLCTGERGVGDLCYAGCKFHRLIPGFMIQGGDFTKGDGTGGLSIYGPSFKDENLDSRHNRRGLLSMANKGPNTNSSQFFMLFSPAPHLDGKHCVFGEVVEGLEVLEELEQTPTNPSTDRPLEDVRIVRCGELLKTRRVWVDGVDGRDVRKKNVSPQKGLKGGGLGLGPGSPDSSSESGDRREDRRKRKRKRAPSDSSSEDSDRDRRKRKRSRERSRSRKRGDRKRGGSRKRKRR